MIRAVEQYLESSNDGRVAYCSRKSAAPVAPSCMDRAGGYFMKRYEGNPEFEESFFKVA